MYPVNTVVCRGFKEFSVLCKFFITARQGGPRRKKSQKNILLGEWVRRPHCAAACPPPRPPSMGWGQGDDAPGKEGLNLMTEAYGSEDDKKAPRTGCAAGGVGSGNALAAVAPTIRKAPVRSWETRTAAGERGCGLRTPRDLTTPCSIFAPRSCTVRFSGKGF